MKFYFSGKFLTKFLKMFSNVFGKIIKWNFPRSSFWDSESSVRKPSGIPSRIPSERFPQNSSWDVSRFFFLGFLNELLMRFYLRFYRDFLVGIAPKFIPALFHSSRISRGFLQEFQDASRNFFQGFSTNSFWDVEIPSRISTGIPHWAPYEIPPGIYLGFFQK